MERCESGRSGRSRKPLYHFFGIGGSNPPLSAFSKTNVFVRSFDAAVSVFLRYETTKKNPVVFFGKMSEWFKVHAWKACIGESLSGVRIPLFPLQGPDALHITAGKPRQIRKEATVFRLWWCRRLSGLSFFSIHSIFYLFPIHSSQSIRFEPPRSSLAAIMASLFDVTPSFL